MQTVLIIGAMKCGTTSLFEWLSRHPKICPACVKEPEYFSRNQDHRIPVDAYDDLFRSNPQTTLWLEASTGYTKYPEEQGIAERMRQVLEKPKFIYLVRNPFDRIESHFNHLQYQLNEHNTDICSGIYLDFSRYATQLAPFAKTFGKESILVIELNDLQEHPWDVLDRCYNFLEIKPRWQERFRRLFRKYFAAHNRASEHHQGPKRRLTPQERQQIHQALQDDMVQLQAEYGIDVSQWGFSDVQTAIAPPPSLRNARPLGGLGAGESPSPLFDPEGNSVR